MHRLPLGTRRCFRLALAAGIATFFAFGLGLTLGHIMIILTISLNAAPSPPPGLKAAAVLVALLTSSAFVGLLIGPILVYVPLAGVLIAMSVVGLATFIGLRPGMAVIGTFMAMGGTILAVLASQSSALAVMLLTTMITQILGAILIGHIVHAIFPDEPVAAASANASAPNIDAGWIALRSAIIMLPAFIAALVNPSAYLMALMKGIMLTQQVDSTRAEAMGRELVGSTAMGGVAAMGLWWLLSTWPSIVMLTLGMMLFVLWMARPLYSAVESRFPPSWWIGTIVTMVILIGPSVGDSSGSDDIQVQLLVRTATFLVLALYASLAVKFLDWLRKFVDDSPRIAA